MPSRLTQPPCLCHGVAHRSTLVPIGRCYGKMEVRQCSIQVPGCTARLHACAVRERAAASSKDGTRLMLFMGSGNTGKDAGATFTYARKWPHKKLEGKLCVFEGGGSCACACACATKVPAPA